jgi:ligand-binding sensor domain-containing protein/serine/threonine protein kinase
VASVRTQKIAAARKKHSFRHSNRLERTFLFLCCLLLLLLPASQGFALDPSKLITQYMLDNWTTDNGLPQNTANAIVQTRDGYLWLGTQEGLVRFDGVRPVIYDRKNIPQLKSNYILALYQDSEGTLWIGTDGGGLTSLKNGKFTNFTTKEGLSNNFVRCIYEDREASLWIGTDAGLSRLKDGRFSRFTTKNGLTNDFVWSISEDLERNLWIGTHGGGLNRLKDGKFSGFTTIDGLSSNLVRCVYVDRDGTLWIGTDDGGLNWLKNGKFAAYTTRDGLSNDFVRCLYQDHDGNLWMGTEGGGLNRLKNQKFSHLTTKEGLSNDYVRSLYEDREGSIWIGTNLGGVDRLKDGKFRSYTTREGLLKDMVHAVYEDREGNVWFGTAGGGLGRLKNEELTNFTTEQGLSSNSILSILEDRQGSLWIGTHDGGLNRLKDGKFSTLTTKQGLLNNDVRSLFEDRDGTLWIGTFGGGLNRLKDGKLTSYTTREGLSRDFLREIYQDRVGNLWIATEDGGVNLLKDGKFTTISTREGLSNNLVRSFYTDPEGNLWIGTSGGGLNRYKNGKFVSIAARDGLFDDVVFAILDDGRGNLWMSCNKGIYRASIKDVNDFADGKIRSVNCISYGKADGMRTPECNGGGQPSGWKTRDGRLWFPTVKGAVVIDPAHTPINEIVPPVYVDEVLIDGQIQRTSANGGVISFEPGKERFEFHYTALSLVDPERVEFQYKLEGFDTDWVQAGTRRAADYTNLPHGDYRFRVKACNNDGVWNEQGASFAFYLKPHFYQTTWFYVFCLLTTAALTIGTHRVRVQQLKVREKELVRAVEEKTGDLRAANVLLQRSNEKLEEAQARISELLDSAPQALENFSAWSKSMAKEVAHTIGATEIAIWVKEEAGLKQVSGNTTKPLALDDLRIITNTVVENGEAIVPLRGISGDLHGALVISGNIVWSETESRLVAGFAHQLAGALETRQMARRLAQAEERKALTLREMHQRGIATLQICPTCGRCYDHTHPHCPEDDTQLHSSRVLPYRIADRYRLVRLVGEGGMGTVFQAHDEKLHRAVAVKIIKPELLNDPMMRARLEREAHMLARLRHPGILAVFDFGELADSSAFLIMEFLDGLDLGKILKTQGPGTPAQIAKVLRQIGDALSNAHSAGIVHRDLKPANLFFVPATDDFQIKVMDFGLAKPIGEDTGLTMTGILLGSPAYMSPEQIRQEPLDERSDLFSLASVVYELLMGCAAFEAEFLPQVLTKVLGDEPIPISTRIQGVDPELDRVFSQAFAKDPDNRPKDVSSWAEMAATLIEKSISSAPGWDVTALKSTATSHPSQGRQNEAAIRTGLNVGAMKEEPGSLAQEWPRLEQIFYAALELSTESRTDYLEKACNNDSALRRKVEALLDFDAANCSEDK